MHPSAETAVCGGNHIFPAHQLGEAYDPVSHQVRVLDNVGGVGDDAGDDDFSVRELGVFPDAPFMLVADIGGLEGVAARIDLQHRADDVREGDVRGVRAVPGTPADVQPDPVLGEAAQGPVCGFNPELDEFEIVGQARFGVDLVPRFRPATDHRAGL